MTRCITLQGELPDVQPQKLLLAFNLFAMEGFHLAEALRVPCLALSPCLVPYAPPASFERRFKQSSSDLYRKLQDAPAGAKETSSHAYTVTGHARNL